MKTAKALSKQKGMVKNMTKAENKKTESSICNSTDIINAAATPAINGDTEKTVPSATNAYPGEKLVRIRIPHTGDDDGDVFVSVNDRNWYIKRGSEVEIPECAAEVRIRREERIADAIDYENRLAANRRK